MQLKPDVVTMDINMPKLDGISAMQMILAEKICPVIMLSSLTQQGAVETFECLALGAFDFVGKPDGTVSANLDTIAEDLIAKIRAAAASGVPKRPRPKAASPPPTAARPTEILLGEPAVERNAGHRDRNLDRRPLHHQHLSPGLTGRSSGGAFSGATHAGSIHPNIRFPAAEGVCHRSGRGRNRGAGTAGRCYVAGNNLHLCPYRKLSGEVVLRRPSQPKTLFVPGVGVMMDSVLAIYGPEDHRSADDRHRGRRRRSDGQDPRGGWRHDGRIGRELRRFRHALSSHQAGRRGDRAAELGNRGPACPHSRGQNWGKALCRGKLRIRGQVHD
jgi:two-component system, chemotaxis family, protein-glutamate methylesterase/glutaminase